MSISCHTCTYTIHEEQDAERINTRAIHAYIRINTRAIHAYIQHTRYTCIHTHQHTRQTCIHTHQHTRYTCIHTTHTDQDEELIRELEALSRKRDERMTALAPLYKPDAREGGANSTKVTNARSSMDSQRRAISDEYEAERHKVFERIQQDLEQQQCAAQHDMETLAKQGGAPGRMRRKTRARGEAGGFLAEREKAHNVPYRLQEIQGKVIVAKDDLDSDLDMLRQKTAKDREKEVRDRGIRPDTLNSNRHSSIILSVCMRVGQITV